MSFRHTLNRMRREYSAEAKRLDGRIDELAERTDKGFEKAQSQMIAFRDYANEQFSAMGETFAGMRADQRELARTLKGRNRLLEERFGKMLEVLSEETPTRADLEGLEARIKALEDKNSAA